MATDNESSVSIQDEEEEYTASIIPSEDDGTINGIVVLNADGSKIGGEEEEEEEEEK